MQPPQPAYIRYGLATGFVGAGLVLALVFQTLVPHGFLLFFLLAVTLAGWFGGTRVGLFAVTVSTVLTAFFFIPPFLALAVNLDELPFFLSFLLSTIVASWLGASRREAQERQQAHLDELFAQNSEAILLMDLGYRVLRVNSQFTNIFGYTLEEIRNRVPTDSIVPPELREEALEQRRDLEGGESVNLETVRQRKDGSRVNVSEVSFPVVAHGKAIGYYSIFRDITESKRAQERLQKAQSELAHLSRMTTMGELASSIAHEINQPIGAIATNADAAVRWISQTPPNVEGVEESLEYIARDANRAANVIERIRALLRKDPTPTGPLDLNEVIREALALTRFETNRRGAVISTALMSPLPPVIGDRVQLHQVLLNLIMNSLDAMDGLSDGARQMHICSTVETDNVVVQVLDSGLGLKAEDCDRIFDPFFTTKRNGIGMGLTISRSIVENHSGRLWATGGNSKGTVMNISLPVAGKKN
jgi:PAS domain S-box-containing protein